MPSYIGFSTINANKPRSTNLPAVIPGKKYRLVDEQLVIQDFINALNIQQGQKVGNPAYGTTLWSFVFEPNTFDVQNKLENEIRRVATQDPRLIVNTVSAYPQENGILIEVELAIAPFNNAQTLSVFFNNSTNTAVIQ
jgi:phage baseplate assembly protein W